MQSGIFVENTLLFIYASSEKIEGFGRTKALSTGMEYVLEKLAGYVEHIIYRNADNGYTVLNLVSGEEEITCVGIFSAIAEGENIEATGEYTDHPTYGKQFKVESFEEKAPEDEEAIERYLGSGAIKEIGRAHV